MYCQHCGRQVPNDSRFCGCCGAKQVLLSQQKQPQPEYPKQNNVPNQVQPPQPEYPKQNNVPNQVQPPQPQYSKPNNVPNQVQPPQPQYPKPNNIPNQVEPPQPQSSVPNSASAFGGSAINKTSGGIKAGQIVGIPKATFIKIIAVVIAAILTVAGSVFIVSNINKKPAKEIIGTWKNDQDSYEVTFHSNGKYTGYEKGEFYEGTYFVGSDDTLELNVDTGYEHISMEFVYVPYENINLLDERTLWWYIEDDTLYLSGVETLFRV